MGMPISGLISFSYRSRHTREGGYPDDKMIFFGFILNMANYGSTSKFNIFRVDI